MAELRIELDFELIEHARELTGARSHRAVAELALRQLIASTRKNTMIDTISELGDLEAPPGTPVGPALQHRGPVTSSGS
ncbi:type II toxin-antitoxin system VapB family antitoxin [Brachybacterium tyrofermentans]|uniref:Type II toxin-antitoxin system VapB family antitoxin n=1 Tax=Brachybacterium tyrofermentans TaxID=47848 RepID=A0ABW0FFV6_9MICO